MVKWIIEFFNFGKKYRKREEEYHRKSKKFGTSGELLTIIFFTALPLLSLWGVHALPWEGGMVALKILCCFGLTTILMAPGELMITGIVALRHRLRMKVQNKVEGKLYDTLDSVSGKEPTEEDDKAEEYKARGTASGYDLTVGILGIVMSVVVVVAFITLCIVFTAQAIE